MNSILNEIRNGDVSPDSIRLLQSRVTFDVDDTDTTKLFTHNADVDRRNDVYVGQFEKGKKRAAFGPYLLHEPRQEFRGESFVAMDGTLKIDARFGLV